MVCKHRRCPSCFGYLWARVTQLLHTVRITRCLARGITTSVLTRLTYPCIRLVYREEPEIHPLASLRCTLVMISSYAPRLYMKGIASRHRIRFGSCSRSSLGSFAGRLPDPSPILQKPAGRMEAKLGIDVRAQAIELLSPRRSVHMLLQVRLLSVIEHRRYHSEFRRSPGRFIITIAEIEGRASEIPRCCQSRT